jgi:transposase-like protein
MKLGRRPAGPEYVHQLGGSDIAKERVKIVLETVAGTCGVDDACQRLDICPQRFHQLRQQIMEGAVTAAEPGTPGRRAQPPTAATEQIERLEHQVAQLQRELQASKAREEITLVLAGRRPTADDPEKKTTIPPRRGRPPGTRKNT